MGVSVAVRYEVFQRDGFKCRYCGRSGVQAVLVIDHIHPRARGGTDEPRNLITACYECNSGKGVKSATPGEPLVTVLAGWLTDCCEVGPLWGPTPFVALLESFNAWASARGVPLRGKCWMGRRLSEAGARSNPRHGLAYSRDGIALKPPAAAEWARERCTSTGDRTPVARLYADFGAWSPFPVALSAFVAALEQAGHAVVNGAADLTVIDDL